MYKSNSSRIFPLILIVIVVIALIAGIITVGRYMFTGSDKNKKEEQSQEKIARDDLLTTTEGRSVRMTIRGPIVANEEFRSYRVSASPTVREYKVYSGYLGDAKDSKVYANNSQAYEQFVYALDKAVFTKPGKEKPEISVDVRGICATGKVYEFEILSGSDVKAKYWTSTCKGSPGSFGANVEQITSLFSKQIPSDVQLEYNNEGINRLRL